MCITHPSMRAGPAHAKDTCMDFWGINGCGLVCRRKLNFAIFGVFPQFYSKKRRKRDVASLPHLSVYMFNKNDPKRAWDCSPKHFLKKVTLGLQSQAFLLVHVGFKVNFLGLFGTKNGLKSQKC